ncbi:MAG: hypothetical protein AB7G25_17715, partial [Sphingomonadaceae bacterium]
ARSGASAPPTARTNHSWQRLLTPPMNQPHDINARDLIGPDHSSQEIVIISPENRTTVLQSGYARPLSWFPQPVIGCALISGKPAWECDAFFVREKLSGNTPNGPDDVVAKALGLTKMSIKERYSGIEWR